MTNTSKFAQALQQAHHTATSITPLTQHQRNFSLQQAYDVASHLHTLHLKNGASFVGRKIGFTNPRMWEQYGIEAPIWGSMYQHTVTEVTQDHSIGGLRSLVEPKIEPEIIFGIKQQLSPQHNIEALLDRIAWVAVGYELVQSHFPNWEFQAPDAVAAGSLHGHLYIGKKHPIEALGADPILTLKNFNLTLYCDGLFVETGTGKDVLENPLNALHHLVQVLATQQADPIGENEIITTGTITLAKPVTIGQTWSISLDGLALTPFDLTLED